MPLILRLLSTILALRRLVLAQNATLPIPCCDINPTEVPSSEREFWCTSNQYSCTEACGGNGRISSSGNSCNKVRKWHQEATGRFAAKANVQDTLDYVCKCNSGAQPDLLPYAYSVPAQKCLVWREKCRAAAVSDLEKFLCDNTSCATKEVDSVGDSKIIMSRPSSRASTATLQRIPSSVTSTIVSASSTVAPQSSSVPIATIVGTIIGVIGAIIILISVLAYAFKHRKNRLGTAKEKRAVSPATYEKAELHGNPSHIEMAGKPVDDVYPYVARGVELSGEAKAKPAELEAEGENRPSELQAEENSNSSELQAATLVAELGTDSVPHGDLELGRSVNRNGTEQY